MLGLSYGEVILILGAAAAVIGPKDLPIMARTAGRIVGKAIGYVQLARGHFQIIMENNAQVNQATKEMRDTLAQANVVVHEIKNPFMNPGPLVRWSMNDPDQANTSAGNVVPPGTAIGQQHQCYSPGFHSTNSASAVLHGQATAYTRLAESQALMTASSAQGMAHTHLADGKSGLLDVLPVSAQSVGWLPERLGEMTSSDIVLEAVVEAATAYKFKDFISQPQNQTKLE